MSGHQAPELGRSNEDEFIELLERIGYKIHRKRDPVSSIDVIAEFQGTPVPQTINHCCLQKPAYAPTGITAFSLKRGDFTNKDVEELIGNSERIKKAGRDSILKNITGCVMVSNHTKTEGELDKLRSKSVYCWDGRRLIFYSIKARESREMAINGPVRESLLKNVRNSSVLIQTGEKIKSAISVNASVFVDDHDLSFVIDDKCVNDLMSEIYEKNLKPYVDSTDLDVHALYRFHFLGLADEKLVRNSYNEYARNDSHPRVTFGASLVVFQYAAAPWRPLFHL